MWLNNSIAPISTIRSPLFGSRPVVSVSKTISRMILPVMVRGLPAVTRRGYTPPDSQKEPHPMDGDQILSVLRDGLFTAVVGDVMDTLGLTRQFLPPEI